jgi:mono/diheme cytochrome c family protein
VPATATATPSPPTATPTPTSLPSAENCIACHTDQAKLEALAVDKTQKSEETEGEG